MTNVRECKESTFYVRRTIENNWSRAVLLNWLDIYDIIKISVVMNYKTIENKAESVKIDGV